MTFVLLFALSLRLMSQADLLHARTQSLKVLCLDRYTTERLASILQAELWSLLQLEAE